MSLARQFFREFRPLFRMLEEPLGRSPSYMGGLPTRSLLEDPFFNSPATWRPPIDVTEEGNNYVVEAELPGVKKEDVDVRIGEGGRSLTIEGKVFSRSQRALQDQQPNVIEGKATEEGSSTAQSAIEGSNAVTKSDSSSNPISTEREVSGSSTFTRTVWLPRPVDGSGVTAQLADGILTVTIPKAEDKVSIKVPVS